MPKPHPLSPHEARNSFAHRFGRVADRLRQLNTRFGVRPYKVQLVWTEWSGRERGQGTEKELARVELLPTPLVQGLDGVAHQFFSGGVLPVGSLRVAEISIYFTQDMLTGLAFPEGCECDGDLARRLRHTSPNRATSFHLERPSQLTLPEPLDFFWEVREDGRGDEPPARNKFRLSAWPNRRADKLAWEVLLERVSNDENRDGTLNSGFDPVGR